MSENIYTPPLTRTIHPPKEHRRTAPNYTSIQDSDRARHFDNFNKDLADKIRMIKHG